MTDNAKFHDARAMLGKLYNGQSLDRSEIAQFIHYARAIDLTDIDFVDHAIKGDLADLPDGPDLADEEAIKREVRETIDTLCDDDRSMNLLFLQACDNIRYGNSGGQSNGMAFAAAAKLDKDEAYELISRARADVVDNGVPPLLPYEQFILNGGAITEAEKYRADALRACAAFVDKARATFKPETNTLA